jgi:hypothetical protein
LQGYLRDISGLAAFNEIFRTNNPMDIDRLARTIDLPEGTLNQLYELQAKNLVVFWALFSQLLYAEGICPAAKIFYPHADRADQIWNEFKKAKILHLIRENVLASVVSRQLAQRSEQWKSRKKSVSYDLEPIQIKRRDCEHHLADLKDNVNWVRQMYADADYTELSYDDLPNIDTAQKVLSAALGCPVNLSKQQFSRQRARPLAEIVINYQEVKRFDRNFSIVERKSQ